MTARVLALIGALVAVAGCFCPFASLPFVGQITYFLNGRGDGVWVVVVAAVVGVTAMLNIVTPAILGSLLIGGLLYSFHDRLAAAVSRVLGSLGQGHGSLLSGLSDMLLRQVHVEWGYWIVALGATLMFLGGMLRLYERASDPTRAVRDPR
ncbi:MAG TPA: hypothetical protein VFB22_08105 [Candidatus Baltobacteraceae bacterium]|nr:hypothetical protein [Candidatus Baltobacteraceae bacterium]